MREEIIGEARLLLCDCREVLPGLSGVDAVLTDPPYGVRKDEWDDMTDREFAQFSMSWLSLVPPICSEAMVFGYIDSAVHTLLKMLFEKVRPLIWAKPPGSQLSGASERKRWFAYEAVFSCYTQSTWSVVEARENAVGRAISDARRRAGLSRGGLEILLRGKKTGLCYRWEEGACIPSGDDLGKLREVLDLNDLSFDAALKDALRVKYSTVSAARAMASANAAEKSDVLSYRTITDGAHPCEKPVPLLLDLIETSGQDWKSIVDPFMGVGSTAMACLKSGRRFIGCESDQRYFDIACRRIESAQRQSDLFVQPAPRPTQPALFGDAA